VRLLPASHIEGLPGMASSRRDEPFYAVQRFDRLEGGGRVHVEDFAQVFNLLPHEKYDKVNHEMIARALLLYGGGVADLKEMARRLMFRVLMGDGHGHLKRWALIYDDPVRPRLAPAYGLVSTVAYAPNDTALALNMGGVKRFAEIGPGTFRRLFERVGLMDRTLDDVVEEALAAGRRVLEGWEATYRENGVPHALIERVKAHQLSLALPRALQA
jgi:serine/threonine-protein kinase HipA